MSTVLPPNVDPLRPGAPTNRRMGLPRMIRLSAMGLALAGVAALGVIVYSASQSGPTTPDQVPLITADNAPLRERPVEEGGMQIANRDSTIYSQLDGQGSQPGLERLVPPPEQPLDPVAPETLPEPRRPDGTPALTSEEIRILQQQRRLQQQRGDAGEQAMQQLAEAASNLPAGVAEGQTSTVVAGAERIEPPPAPAPVASAPEAVETPQTVAEAAIQPVAPVAEPPAATPAPAAAPETTREITSLSPAQIVAQGTRPRAGNPESTVVAPAPAPAAPSAQDERRAAAVAPAAGASSRAVQLGAVRTEEAARNEWRRLQAKFQGQLGALEPQIQQADLGARGIYWRIRGGNVTEAQGKQICEALKAAGQSCLVVSR